MMDDIQTEITCKYGHKCKEYKEVLAPDGTKQMKLFQCASYVEMVSTNDQTGEKTTNTGCSDAFQVVLLNQTLNGLRSIQASIDALRNEVAQGHVSTAQTMLNLLPIK